MAKRKSSNLSVAQLEKLLAKAKNKVLVTALNRKKASLQAELSSVDKELQSLKEGKASRRRRGKRPKNTQSLATVVTEILGNTTKGLSLDDLVAKVRDSGYKTKAKSFSNVVYQCVYNTKGIYRDKKNRTYRMQQVNKKS